MAQDGLFGDAAATALKDENLLGATVSAAIIPVEWRISVLGKYTVTSPLEFSLWNDVHREVEVAGSSVPSRRLPSAVVLSSAGNGRREQDGNDDKQDGDNQVSHD